MAQKMKTYDEMSTTKKVTLEYHRNPQDYVLRSPNVERNYPQNILVLFLTSRLDSVKFALLSRGDHTLSAHQVLS